MPALYFLRDTTRSTCLGAGDDLDLSRTQGSGATWQSGNTQSDPFVTMATFDIDVRADGASPGDGSHNIRVSINSITSDCEVRWRLEVVNSTSGCTVQDNGTWFLYSTAGLKSDTEDPFAPGAWTGNDVLRLIVQVRKSGGNGHKNVTLYDDSMVGWTRQASLPMDSDRTRWNDIQDWWANLTK